MNERDELARNEILAQGWIRFLDWRERVDSTNNVARQWLSSTAFAELPALFVTDAQTSGRGRSENRWWSPPGCLMLTLVIDGNSLPSDPTQWSQLALVCGVAAAETAASFVDAPAVQLKWPNDVYLDGLKCGGILIESGPNYQKRGSKRTSWLIGIGMNVDVDWAEAPTAVATQATCLQQHLHPSLAVSTVLVETISKLHQWIVGWKSGKLHWQDAWRERCLLTGRTVRIRTAANQVLVGRCEGVDASGQLLVRTRDGIEFYNSAESIEWR